MRKTWTFKNSIKVFVPNILPWICFTSFYDTLLLHSRYKPNLTRKNSPAQWRLENFPSSFWVLAYFQRRVASGREDKTHLPHAWTPSLWGLWMVQTCRCSKIQTKNQRMKIQLSCFSEDYDKQEIIKSFTLVENLIWNLKYQLLYQPEKWMLDDTTWSWICLFDAWKKNENIFSQTQTVIKMLVYHGRK